MGKADLVADYGDRLAAAAERLAGVADAANSDPGYFECGYFLIFFTVSAWRRTLGLASNETTSTISWVDNNLLRHLVARRAGTTPAWRSPDDPHEQWLGRLSTHHGVAYVQRQAWYERFDSLDEPGPGDLMWEFCAQISRSTGHEFDRDRFVVQVMAETIALDHRTFVMSVAQ
jgi:hypothetical protein